MPAPFKSPKRGRKLLDEEEWLWREAMRDVMTLRGRKAASKAKAPVPLRPNAQPAKPAQKALPPVKHAVPAAPAKLGSGVDGGTARRMAQGRIAPEATLDLHGMTQNHAHDALERFLGHSIAHDRRCVLVITGKGGMAKGRDDRDAAWAQRRPGVLKSLVPLWLEHSAHRGRVASIRAAHIRHGGDGALYVYLRGK
jgi:DNA-nicking Smr family endonuclease